MRRLSLCSLIACCTLAAPAALAQDHAGMNQMKPMHAVATKAVNEMCPIGKEPIDPSAGTVEYKGHQIGLCCPGCGEKFLAQDEAAKDKFIALAIAHQEPGQVSIDDESWSEPYTLNMCAVSGEAFDDSEEAVVKKFDGREVRFCCNDCAKEFAENLDASWEKVDAAIIKDQMRYYPLQTCIVSGEPLTDEGEDIAKNVVYGNRLIRLCCKMCVNDFKKDPKAFIAKLDKAAADEQRENYPFKSCIVSGGELGGMGEPYEMVLAGRLIRFCCDGCVEDVEANPAKFIAQLDAAWQAEGMYMPADANMSIAPTQMGSQKCAKCASGEKCEKCAAEDAMKGNAKKCAKCADGEMCEKCAAEKAKGG